MTLPPDHSQIDAVRQFSRFYTGLMGVLEEGLHGSPFPLPEARLLYEIGERGRANGRDLARDLALDPGYVSRLIGSLEAKAAVTRARNPDDGRQMDIALSEAGEAHYQRNVAMARDMVADILARLPVEARADLVGQLQRVEALFSPETQKETPIILRPHRAGDMGWVVASQAEFYSAEYGWDHRYEALVAEIVAKFLREFDPAWEACWIAERGGARVGSVFVVKVSDSVAKLRLLYVDPAARGVGLGKTLVNECIRFARSKGYTTLMLWTNDNLTTARQIYEKAGFKLTGAEKHSDFGPEVTGQTWELVL